MGLTGCNDEAFDIDSVNKQTLLIMYPWSGTENSAGLYSDMVNNLNQIENAIKKNKGLKSTRVFVFMSTSATESSLFELTYNSSTFTVEHQMLENYTGTAYTTTEGLTDIIGEVKQQAQLCPDYRRTRNRMEQHFRLDRLSQPGQEKSCTQDPLFWRTRQHVCHQRIIAGTSHRDQRHQDAVHPLRCLLYE